jgi:hypothetical protein
MVVMPLVAAVHPVVPQDYAAKGYTHKNVFDVFSLNRKISIADI